jgi:hypothetical protein
MDTLVIERKSSLVKRNSPYHDISHLKEKDSYKWNCLFCFTSGQQGPSSSPTSLSLGLPLSVE